MHKTLKLVVDIDSVEVDDVALPSVKFSDAKRHASLLSSFLFENSSYIFDNEIINFQNLVGNLDKMIVANLGRQHQTFGLVFQEFLRIFVFFGVISYFHTIYVS